MTDDGVCANGENDGMGERDRGEEEITRRGGQRRREVREREEIAQAVERP